MTTYANPGAVDDVVTATAIETTWGNAIRDRVIQNFANTTARDAAITSPVLGMHCYVAGVGLQQYCGATALWQKPWYMPWGFISKSNVTASQLAVTSSVITNSDLTWTAIANRWYRYAIHVPMVIQNTSTGLAKLAIQLDTVALTVALDRSLVATERFPVNAEAVFTVAAGSHTIRSQVATSAGTIDITSSATTDPGFAQYALYDMGPNGDPP